MDMTRRDLLGLGGLTMRATRCTSACPTPRGQNSWCWLRWRRRTSVGSAPGDAARRALPWL